MGTYHKIISKIWHQGFDPYTFDNDIGLIKTKTQIMLQGEIVALLNLEPISNLHDGNFSVYGWGLTQTGLPETLNQLQIYYANNSYCDKFDHVKEGRSVCFTPKYSDQMVGGGDSGSPIVFQTTYIDQPSSGHIVVSLVSGNILKEGKMPIIVGPNVSYYDSWIDSIVNMIG